MVEPRKRFGQHFLIDQTIIERIVDTINPKAQQHLVEIGPGKGALTLPLLKRIAHLDAIELDRDLILALENKCKKIGSLKVYNEDVLKFNFKNLTVGNEPLRIIGNLPYNISTPLIFHLLQFQDVISDMVFMLQKEVADRLAAKENTESFGRLSVMVQYHCEVTRLFDVKATAFYPPPQVTSTVVQLTPYKTLPYLVTNYDLFATIVRLAFNQRRKTIRNSLRAVVHDNIWASLDIHSDLRAENLSVKDFVEIANQVNNVS